MASTSSKANGARSAGAKAMQVASRTRTSAIHVGRGSAGATTAGVTERAAACAAGRTGVMAGRGYFDWGGRAPEELFRERDRKLLALKAAMAVIGRMEGT